MEILSLSKTKDRSLISGYVQISPHQFYKYVVELKKPVFLKRMPMYGPDGDGGFQDRDHFYGVMGGFMPYYIFLEKPLTVKEITFEALSRLYDNRLCC